MSSWINWLSTLSCTWGSLPLANFLPSLSLFSSLGTCDYAFGRFRHRVTWFSAKVGRLVAVVGVLHGSQSSMDSELCLRPPGPIGIFHLYCVLGGSRLLLSLFARGLVLSRLQAVWLSFFTRSSSHCYGCHFNTPRVVLFGSNPGLTFGVGEASLLPWLAHCDVYVLGRYFDILPSVGVLALARSCLHLGE